MRWRLRYTLRRRLGNAPRLPTSPEHLETQSAALEALRDFAGLCQVQLPPPPQRLAGLRDGTFTFLNETEHAPKGPPWAVAAKRSRLWQYHLHYFDYARDLAIDNADVTWDDDRALLRGWMRDWLQRFPPGANIAWDAFTISARLVNWCIAEAVFAYRDERVLECMFQQSEWLLRHLEYDISANHLLKNAVALTVAGTVLGTRMADQGLRLLESEVRAQVLPDGGHYERSPMYHALVLEDLLIAYAVLPEKPAWLGDAIARMAGWLEAVCHPDGDIPLFCDAALNASPRPAALIALAARVIDRPPETPEDRGGTSYFLQDSGYAVLAPANRRGWMILKTAPPAPDHQPGHAHCDLFSYEFSAKGRRMIVDSGTHGYAGSRHRVYCRSTAAHNTVQVGAQEQHECWSTFRVGRRAQVLRCDWTDHSIDAEHDGFAPGIHRRRATFDGKHTWRIEDTVAGATEDWRSYVHLHPDVTTTSMDDGPGYRLTRDGACLFLVPEADTGCTLQPADAGGLYCPEFGIALPAPVLVFTPRTRDGIVAYTIVANDAPA